MYIIVVTNSDKFYDCILHNSYFETRQLAEVEIGKCKEQDKKENWTYSYEIIQIYKFLIDDTEVE